MRQAMFRVDAAPAIGGGHVMRCLALAAALSEAGWQCRFLVAEGTLRTVTALAHSGHSVEEGERHWHVPESFDLLVVDHYRLDARYERGWRGRARSILVIDDLADRPHACDLLLDQGLARDPADYRGLVAPGCRLLLGPRYALLRPEFARRREEALARRGAARVERVLIAPGATDPTNLAAPLIAAAETLGDVAIDIAIGSAAPHLDELRRRAAASGRLGLHIDSSDMAELMVRADLCLGAGGGTSWERCCLGLPTIVAVISPDQALMAKGLAAAGAAEIAAAEDPVALAAAVRALAAESARRQAMSAAAAGLCDGGGARRIAALLAETVPAEGLPAADLG